MSVYSDTEESYRNKFISSKLISNVLDSSLVVREDSHHFTFSPYLDTETNFSSGKKGLAFKSQLCVRYINKLDLTCPMALNSQIHYCIQGYEVTNQVKNIDNILQLIADTYKLDSKKIKIIVPKFLFHQFQDYRDYIYEICNDEDCEAQLNLQGKHLYVRVAYSYNQEFVIFCNFVLVDFDRNLSMLDSIIYQERLQMIHEGKRYICQRSIYKPIIDSIQQTKARDLSPYQLHVLFNDFFTIFLLNNLGVKLTNKGKGSELKRKIKHLAIFNFFYCGKQNMNYSDIIHIFNEYTKVFDFDNSSDKEKLFRYFIDVQNDIEKVYKKYFGKNISDEEIRYLIETKGVPKEIFCRDKEMSVTRYNFLKSDCGVY